MASLSMNEMSREHKEMNNAEEGKEHKEVWLTVSTDRNEKNVCLFLSSDLQTRLRRKSTSQFKPLNNCYDVVCLSVSVTS